MSPEKLLIHLLWILATVKVTEACCVYSYWYFWFGMFWIIVFITLLVIGCIKKNQRTPTSVARVQHMAVVTAEMQGPPPNARHVYENPQGPTLISPPEYSQASFPPPPYQYSMEQKNAAGLQPSYHAPDTPYPATTEVNSQYPDASANTPYPPPAATPYPPPADTNTPYPPPDTSTTFPPAVTNNVFLPTGDTNATSTLSTTNTPYPPADMSAMSTASPYPLSSSAAYPTAATAAYQSPTPVDPAYPPPV